MSVRIVGASDGVDVWIRPIAFEGVSDTRGVVPPGFAEGDERLPCARVRCHKHGLDKSGRDCLTCDGFRGWSDVDVAEIRVHCVWSGHDRAAARMTAVDDVVTVPPSLSCRDAELLARAENVHRVVVMNGDELRGVVCRCQLGHDSERAVGELVGPTLFALDADATLGEAAGAMATLGIGCLPIIGHAGELAGVITRGDLRRLGAPDEALATRLCAGCGSAHGVCPDAHGIDTCLACRELREAFLGDRQFGEGD